VVDGSAGGCTVLEMDTTSTSALRVGTLNLWHADLDRELRTQRAAEWMSELDVLCVQEVADDGEWNTLRELETRSGVPLVTPERVGGVASRVGVFSTLPVLESAMLELPGAFADGSPLHAAMAVLDVRGEEVPVFSVHLAWGSPNEWIRLEQLQHLASFVDERWGADTTKVPAVIAGDFNATPDSDSVRYLSGLRASRPGTLWTDAWSGAKFPGADGTTSDGSNPYAVWTATSGANGAGSLVRDDLLPDRRIDFVFIRGWRYGRPFSPVQTEVVREPLMSDHYPVVTTLLLEA
jgi:endonuclease/exonuclease/phosphatase family metal-dependent hydrolase